MKKRIISVLIAMLLASAFITGCFAKENVDEADDPWVEYRISQSAAKNRAYKNFYLVKQNKQHYILLDYGNPISMQILGGFLIYNDIPALVAEDGDSIRYYYDYFSDKADKIRLVKVNPPKGALHFIFEGIFDESGKMTLKEFYSFKVLEENSMITDKDGNEIGDVWNNMYKLNMGETYKISVQEEEGLYEEEMTADWTFYSCDDFDNEIVIHPDLSKKGYATYNLSSLEPGYYCVINGVYNVIEVK